MKIILERNLNFIQFQNLVIVTFVLIMTFLAMLNSLALVDFILIKIILFLLIIFFTLLLLTKKGLVVENNRLYKAVFLFNQLILRKEVPNNLKRFSLLVGKLSTNYNYSYEIADFHNWEPNLNVSISAYSLMILSDDHRKRMNVLTLTKIEKAKEAVDFVIKNTSLKYEKYNPT